MKIALVVLALIGLVAVPKAGAQTIAQCTANKNAWLDTYKSDEVQLGYQTLVDRANDMSSCASLFLLAKDHASQADCLVLMSVYEEQILNRLGHFINRHNAFNKFLVEDQQGRR